MDTLMICGRCGGMVVCIVEEGTEAAKAYGKDKVARVYCQHCDEIPDAKAMDRLLRICAVPKELWTTIVRPTR